MNKIVTLPHPMNAAMLESQHEIDRRLIRLLYDARPHRLVVWKVMVALHVQPDSDKGRGQEYKFQTFLAFCLSRARVAQILSRHGFELKRSGGTVDHEVWIESVQRACS